MATQAATNHKRTHLNEATGEALVVAEIGNVEKPCKTLSAVET